MATYIIRAALHEEANAGWVWIEEFPSRSIVKISNNATGHAIVCEVRRIDGNFVAKYNTPQRFNIARDKGTLVISQWYRDALGGFNTTGEDNKSGAVDLNIEKCRFQTWASIRAACFHPDIVVRLGTRLGVLGVWLGVMGLVPVATDAVGLSNGRSAVLFIIAAALAFTGCFACRGPKRAATA